MKSFVSGWALQTAAALFALFVFSACDDSSDDDSFGSSDSAQVVTSVSPDRVAIGNLAFITATFDDADFDDLDSQGLTIKLLVPQELSMKRGSATLTMSRGAIGVAPFAVEPAPDDLVNDLLAENSIESNEGSASSGGFVFYVFALPPSLLGDETGGDLQMTFSVDALPARSVLFTDLDRGAVTGFSAANADFDAEVVTEFEVDDGTSTEDE